MSKRSLLALLAPLVLSGCIASAVGADEAPDETFLLDTPNAVGELSAARGVQLLVPEPSAVEVVVSKRIIVRVGPREVQYLGGARLGDSVTRLTQFKMKRALEAGRGIGAVGLPGEGLAIDYQVLTDIRAFEIVAGPPSIARVALTVRLLDDRSGNVVAGRVFTASAPVPGGTSTTNDRYLAALDIALDAALIDIRSWVVARV